MANPLKKLARAPAVEVMSVRYMLEKLATQMRPLAIDMLDANPRASTKFQGRLGTLLKEGILAKQLWATSLCSQMLFGGEAMAPAITSQPRFVGEGADEKDGGGGGKGGGRTGGGGKPPNLLLVRQLFYPEFAFDRTKNITLSQTRTGPLLSWFPRRAHVGDVVVLAQPSPLDRSVPGGLLVRRVMALEGEVLEGGAGVDGTSDDDFVIPKGHAWVMADTEDAPFADVPDSRTFGPLPLQNVLGRVVYAVRSATDHGVVHNSAAAARVDQPVLQVELDVAVMAEELTDFTTGRRTFRRVSTEDDDLP